MWRIATCTPSVVKLALLSDDEMRVDLGMRIGEAVKPRRQPDIEALYLDVRFTPENGYWELNRVMSALCQKQTFCDHRLRRL